MDADAMSTRAEQVEACRYAAAMSMVGPLWIDDRLSAAAATLTRDGELRERLAKLCATARELGHPEAAALARHVEALLKEFS